MKSSYEPRSGIGLFLFDYETTTEILFYNFKFKNDGHYKFSNTNSISIAL